VHPTKSPKREVMVGGSEGEDHGWSHRAVRGSRGGGEEGKEVGVDGGCAGRWRAAGVDGELLNFGYILSCRRCYNSINLLLKLFCCFAALLRCCKIFGEVSDKFGLATIIFLQHFTVVLQMENIFATGVSGEVSGEFSLESSRRCLPRYPFC
jgi:hypothetical protein